MQGAELVSASPKGDAETSSGGGEWEIGWGFYSSSGSSNMLELGVEAELASASPKGDAEASSEGFG